MTTFADELKSRFAALGVIILLALGVLLVRLWVLQVLQGDGFAVAAEENRVRTRYSDAPRGRILDREKGALVTNRSALAVMAAPSVVKDPALLTKLSAVLGMPASEIEDRLRSYKQGPLEPRLLRLEVPMTVVSYLAEHQVEFPGVEVRAVPVRQYPKGRLAAHVLGYTGEITEAQLDETDVVDYQLGDVVGRTGAELQFESVLQGDKGQDVLEVDASGRPKRILARREPIAGHDVVLTIDSEVQKVTERALDDAMEEAHSQRYPKARAGAAVAIDVKTGEIIAMASRPTYEPAEFLGGISQKEWKRLNDKKSEFPLTNRAVMSAYPPASTFKVVTGMAALQKDIATEWSGYNCGGRWTAMGEEWSKYCWNRSGHGTITFHQGVSHSCDVVFYELGYEFYKRKREELQKYSRTVGLGSKSGVDLPGEVTGRVPDAAWKKAFNKDYPEYQMWLPGDTVNMAIGQGDMLVTPLQLADVYAGIANGGTIYRPHVLKAVLSRDGRTVRKVRPEVLAKAKVSKEDTAVMRRSLVSVTKDGTAAGAFAGFPVDVAGKTGTAEVKGKDDYAFFAAFAPADDPKYAVAVVVEQGGHGGSVAAPAGRQMLAALLGLPVGEMVHTTDDSR